MFVVDCVSEDDECYTVLVQHFPKVTKRLKKTKELTFQPWEQHMKSAIINPVHSHSELRDAPNGNLIKDIPDYIKMVMGITVYKLMESGLKFTIYLTKNKNLPDG